MGARVESQADSADDEAPPSIPSAFENDYMLGATEAIMWIACRRRFSHDTIREHLKRHRDHGQWRYGRSQLRRPLWERAEKAERQVIGLIIGGVPATGTLHDEGDPDHKKRVPVPVEFLKDGAYIELLSGHIRADLLLEKHGLYERPTYRDVYIDRDAFFKALAKGQEDAPARTLPPHDEPDPQEPAETPVPEGPEDEPRTFRERAKGWLEDMEALRETEEISWAEAARRVAENISVDSATVERETRRIRLGR